jgi:carbonic anhydrase
MQQKKLESLPPSDRNRYFVQVNVIEQMKLVKELLEIINPAQHRQIEIHGFLYDRMRNRADRILLNE